MKKKCSVCKIKFPMHLVQFMTHIQEGVICRYFVCPICALNLRNTIHGLNDKKFQGEVANILLEEAREFLRKSIKNEY